MQRLAFLSSLKIYLEEERFAAREEVAEILGGTLSCLKILPKMLPFELRILQYFLKFCFEKQTYQNLLKFA